VKSISALKKLNAVGYGSTLPLSLVYNPLGAKLPGSQAELEADYKQELRQQFGIEFTRLFTITNQPIARFAEDLRRHGQWHEYLELLANNFNPATVEGLMCRSTISIGWMGEVFDCDFNQMLKMQVRNGKPLHLWDVTPQHLMVGKFKPTFTVWLAPLAVAAVAPERCGRRGHEVGQNASASLPSAENHEPVVGCARCAFSYGSWLALFLLGC